MDGSSVHREEGLSSVHREEDASLRKVVLRRGA